MARWLVFCGLLLGALGAAAGEQWSFWGAGEARPRGFPPAGEEEIRFGASAGEWKAWVAVPARELAAPRAATATLFFRGKKKDERFLQLPPAEKGPVTYEGPQGPMEAGLMAVAVSPRGDLLALKTPSGVLVFRGETQVRKVKASPVSRLALTGEALFLAPMAATPGGPRGAFSTSSLFRATAPVG